MSSVPAVLDSVLDLLVVPGFSRFGYAVRRRGWSTGDPTSGALVGATVAVTGANSGIGKAVSVGLANLGATVLMVVRDRERGETARGDVLAAVPGAEVAVERCDVADLGDVRSFATDLRVRRPRLDAVIHNAGAMPPDRTETVDGHELSLALHVLGPLLLTETLLPALSAAPNPRVVSMSSGGMYTQSLPVDDIEYRRGHYRGATAYARSKRIQVALTGILARRWSEHRIMVAAMHPGWVDTPGIARSLPGFRRITGPILRSAEQGADTAVWLAATRPTPPTGEFWHDRRVRRTHYLPTTRADDQELERVWRYCAGSVGLPAH